MIKLNCDSNGFVTFNGQRLDDFMNCIKDLEEIRYNIRSHVPSILRDDQGDIRGLSRTLWLNQSLYNIKLELCLTSGVRDLDPESNEMTDEHFESIFGYKGSCYGIRNSNLASSYPIITKVKLISASHQIIDLESEMCNLEANISTDSHNQLSFLDLLLFNLERCALIVEIEGNLDDIYQYDIVLTAKCINTRNHINDLKEFPHLKINDISPYHYEFGKIIPNNLDLVQSNLNRDCEVLYPGTGTYGFFDNCQITDLTISTLDHNFNPVISPVPIHIEFSSKYRELNLSLDQSAQLQISDFITHRGDRLRIEFKNCPYYVILRFHQSKL